MVELDIPPQLYALFLSSLESSLERIEESLAGSDLEGVSFHAHAIRGTCGAYGHEDLSVKAGVIEDLADAGDAVGVHGAVATFSQDARAVLDASKS